MASRASSDCMPHPLSETRINDFPPFSTSTTMRVLFASSAFSSNSFTTEAGRSTTSPAAILFDRISGRILILDMDASLILNSGKVMVVSSPMFLNLGKDFKSIKEEELADFMKGDILIIKSGRLLNNGSKEYHEIKVSQIAAITFEVE